MKRLFAFAITATMAMMGLSLQAQITHTQQGNVDQQAQQMLQKAAQKFVNNPVSFHVAVTNKDSQKKDKGTIHANVVYSNNRYRVEADQNVIYCDGKSIWHWTKNANEVVVYNLNANDDMFLNPATLLRDYAKEYRAKFIRTENDGTSVIDLTPVKSRSFYKLRLLVNSTGVLKSITMHNYDSSMSVYTISACKTGVQTKESDFTFSTVAHPKVEVIDMR